MTDNIKAKRKIKDSVFTDLFRIPKYQTELVNALDPQINAKSEDIELVTLKNVFINQIYNDFGALVKNKLIFCVESQSTWSLNIIFRLFIYAANTYQSYINDKKHGQIDLYTSMKQELPVLNCSVIYCGKVQRDLPKYISLNKDFWKGNSPLDLKVRVLNTAGKENIVEEYISFCHTFDEQVNLYGYTLRAIQETIGKCLCENILQNYLEERQKEVQNIMFTLLDEEELQRRHLEYERAQYRKQIRDEVKNEVEQEKETSIIKTMLSLNTPLDFISKVSGWSEDKIRLLQTAN